MATKARRREERMKLKKTRIKIKFLEFTGLFLTFRDAVPSWLRGFVVILVTFCFSLFAQAQPDPSVDSRLQEIGQKLDQSKAKVQELKDAWDKAR